MLDLLHLRLLLLFHKLREESRALFHLLGFGFDNLFATLSFPLSIHHNFCLARNTDIAFAISPVVLNAAPNVAFLEALGRKCLFAHRTMIELPLCLQDTSPMEYTSDVVSGN